MYLQLNTLYICTYSCAQLFTYFRSYLIYLCNIHNFLPIYHLDTYLCTYLSTYILNLLTRLHTYLPNLLLHNFLSIHNFLPIYHLIIYVCTYIGTYILTHALTYLHISFLGNFQNIQNFYVFIIYLPMYLLLTYS